MVLSPLLVLRIWPMGLPLLLLLRKSSTSQKLVISYEAFFSQGKADKMGLKGTCILRDYMYVAQDPVDQILMGPAYGIARLLERTGLTVADIDVWEIHEAFAGQVLANLEALKTEEFCQKSIGVKNVVGEVPMEKLNNWGGSLSMGHPFGATGIRLVSHCANRLKVN